MKIKRREIVDKEKLKQLIHEFPANGFESMQFGRMAVTFLFRKEATYVITSDIQDPLSVRKAFLREIARQTAPKIEEMKENDELDVLNALIVKNIKDRTPLLGALREKASFSILLGILGGVAFTFFASQLGTLTGYFLRTEVYWVSFLSLIIFSLLAAFLVGSLTGNEVGGFIGSYITLLSIFSLPLGTTVSPRLTTILPLLKQLTDLYNNLPFSQFTMILLIVSTFPLTAAITSGRIGLFFSMKRLFTTKIPPTSLADMRESTKRIENLFELLAKLARNLLKTEKGIEATEELQKITEVAKNALEESQNLLDQIEKEKIKKSFTIEGKVTKKAREIIEIARKGQKVAQVERIRKAMESIEEQIPKAYPGV